MKRFLGFVSVLLLLCQAASAGTLNQVGLGSGGNGIPVTTTITVANCTPFSLALILPSGGGCTCTGL